MMNLFKLSEQLKDFSKDQLVQEMKMPSGSVPQYLILSELQRRTRMEQAAAGAEGGQPTTVAEDAVAAAGVPQAGLAGMARAMAPKTDMTENSGIAAMAPQMPTQRMQEGGEVEGPNTARLRSLIDLQRALGEARVQSDVNRQRILRAGREDEPRIADVSRRVRDFLGSEIDPVDEFGGLPTEAPRRAEPETTIDTSGAYADLLTAPSTIDRMFGDLPPIQGPVEPEPYSSPRRAAPLSARPDILMDMVPGPRRPGPVQGPNLPRQPVDPGEFSGLPDYMTDQYAEPPEDIRNPLRVLFGDEAIDAIPPRRRDPETESLPQDTGTPLDEQDVDDLLPPPREAEEPAGPGGPGGPGGAAGGATDLDRLYEQDRWLSLARFGLGLMSSREPTLGGAIGEAGANALDYMAGARESMMDRRMQEAELDLARQRLALEAAGGGGDPRGIGARDLLGAYIDRADGARSRYQDLYMVALEMVDPRTGEIPGFMQDQLLRAQSEIAQYDAALSQFGIGGSDIGDVPQLNFNVADR